MNLQLEDIPGMRITVMGLGLHGGGAAAARFFASLGARVLVTDLRSSEELSASLSDLKDLEIEYRLGEHRLEDFSGADLVIKNPAVPPGSEYLKAAHHVSSDIAVFLGLSGREVFAITGTKGKSTTASAVHHVLSTIKSETDLGGNITISPLNFLLRDMIKGRLKEKDAPVVLELSSWQLADCLPREVLKPRYSMITNIMHDHQNRYDSFEDYVADKALIFSNQDSNDVSIFNYDDPYGRKYAGESRARVLYFSGNQLPATLEGGFLKGTRGFLRREGKEVEILPETLAVPGAHNRLNLLAAAVMLASSGVPVETIKSGLADFHGIPHRLEEVARIDGVLYVNDSAATIPEAAAAAIASFDAPVRLIAGGTDKELDFTGFSDALRRVAGLYLLKGNATPRFEAAAEEAGIRYRGPFESLEEALMQVRAEARPGDVVLLSPGCASFGMFRNEFHRGDLFRDYVRSLAGTGGL
ncbi:UDP-N-acetylmuramoyl-L-alanine--D-glutamate ligase [Marispirochaeta aestuarii]|uniref:UDP-N-acetylmuramoyl-L-alanine--D-glutamate ligase n=1 Tax=Marispirochaeta aestuarii TaxID=1963862 RepID=UPI0029C7A7AD|nr:UDP-N-acetylmuramoyl-L-alanine--D-glutamate ligase [Marispirochaeta aestuarii]